MATLDLTKNGLNLTGTPIIPEPDPEPDQTPPVEAPVEETPKAAKSRKTTLKK